MNKINKILLVFLVVLLISGCSSVVLTNRTQLNLIPRETILNMSFDQHNLFLEENTVSSDPSEVEMVKRVGIKIQHSVENYFSEQNLSKQLKDYDWEFDLVVNSEPNAWCMPGGKVVVYTGILSITNNENGLAVVMGHEVAHSIARHGNERMSQTLIAQLGGIALYQALEERPEETQQFWMSAYGLGAQAGLILPYSRLHESEADRLGLIFMAMAGYDPNGAVNFWQRMGEHKSGASPPEFLSTHPSDKTRIEKIESHLPEAMAYYVREN
ncbi:MAG: M48 family metallopeptidase [Candidatus Neomarinimicrobiota bacterium]